MAEQAEPLERQFPEVRGRNSSLRVIVYDRAEETLEVQSIREIRESRCIAPSTGFITEKQRLDNEDYIEVRVPPRKKRLDQKVTLYADAKTDRPTFDYVTKGQIESNNVLARLRLDRLKAFDRIFLRVHGRLSAIYVKDPTPWQDYSSPNSISHSVDILSS